MTELIRLTYASKTTALPNMVQRDLIDILHQSIQFNAKHSISGVLFYNNNYFFQCLEGERNELLKLYEKITKDSRHVEVVQLACENIDVAAFGQWEMKYILEDSRIRHFFVHYYGQSFNPYLLNDGLYLEFIELLRESPAVESMELEIDSTLKNLEYNKPFYASRSFALFVIMPLIVISIIFYLIG